MSKNLEIWRGDPYPLGATLTDEGVNFALYAENAIAVELCLFDSLEPIATAREPAFARSGEAYGSAAAYDLRDRSIVLLQLKSNPWLFDSWNTKRELAFKADGQMFNRPK